MRSVSALVAKRDALSCFVGLWIESQARKERERLRTEVMIAERWFRPSQKRL